MGQKNRPDLDITNVGNWLDAIYGSNGSELFDELDELVSDGLTTAINRAISRDSTDSFEVRLNNVIVDPLDNNRHFINVSSAGPAQTGVEAILKQASTEKASGFFRNTPAMQDFQYELLPAEADSITDYNDLSILVKPWAYTDHTTDSELQQIFDSMYETKQKLSVLQKQRFVEWFSGNTLDTIWTQNNNQGTNTFQMADVIDGGFEIITGTSTNDDGSISFNDKRHYNFNASVIIFVMQQITAASYRCQAGFADSNNLPSGDSAYIDNNTDFTNYRLLTFDNGGGTAASLGVAIDQLPHSFKVETKASSVEGFIDGVLRGTNSTNLPNVKMQPVFQVKTLTTASKTGRIRYLEAYNT